MKEENFRRSMRDFISKFKNGEERYNKSTTVNTAVRSLVNGIDPYVLIDRLCQMIDDNKDGFYEYLRRDTRPPQGYEYKNPITTEHEK